MKLMNSHLAPLAKTLDIGTQYIQEAIMSFGLLSSWHFSFCFPLPASTIQDMQVNTCSFVQQDIPDKLLIAKWNMKISPAGNGGL